MWDPDGQKLAIKPVNLRAIPPGEDEVPEDFVTDFEFQEGECVRLKEWVAGTLVGSNEVDEDAHFDPSTGPPAKGGVNSRSSARRDIWKKRQKKGTII